jgi:F-type H+-transporting ATPase subunit b
MLLPHSGAASACEFGRKRANPLRALAVAAAVAALLLAAGGSASAQERAAEAAATAERAAVEHAAPGESGHEEGLLPLVAKVFNFVLLGGVLVYFLRAPIAKYVADRRAQVRAELESAAALTRSAEAQMAELEARLQALPAEIEALKARSRAETAAEEQRIREAAARERQRLLDQATREIEQQVRVAHRELVEHAARLAVGIAETRIRQHINSADRTRLVDRYLEQVAAHE